VGALPVAATCEEERAASFPFSRFAHYSGCLLLVISACAYVAWLPFGPVAPVLSDFSAYYAAGRYWLAGGDPYSAGIWSIEKAIGGGQTSRLELLPFVGPPLSLLLFAAFGVLPYSIAAITWGLIVTASAGVVVVISLRLARRRIERSDAISLLLLMLASGPVVTAISAGQAALPAAAAVAVAIFCAARRRWLLMALAVAVAATLKPNDALVLAATVRAFAGFVAVAGAGFAFIVANLPIAHGAAGIISYLQTVVAQGASERGFAYQFAPSAIAYGLGMTAHLANVVGIAVAIATLCIVGAAIRSTRAGIVDGAAIACAAFPFVLPFEHEPDMVIALLPALFVTFRARGWTWAIGGLGAVLLSTNPFALTQGWPGILFTVAMAAVAGLQIAALSPPSARPMRIVPLAVAPLVLAIGLLAPPEHLPLWPSTLPAHVTIAPGATASTIWRDELVASKLEIRRPWVSVMRLLTLCGCALITVAMIRTAAVEPDEA
jgi:hypothetical protein